MRHKLDSIDRNILVVLQKDGRLSNTQLAERVGLTPAPCLRRVRALEEAGVIQKYAALVDSHALALGVTVFAQVTLDKQVKDQLEVFEQSVGKWPEVMDCYLMTGDSDYLLRIVLPDVEAYERFLNEALTQVPGVASIKSSFALRQVKYSTALPLIPEETDRQPA
ncbi:MAG TPA: Lrp/AsnC family transcriptional regulator [Acidobacteria bacterium]|jgi:DNA-binding Lrp family transcriptional regulator|nr:Lrp/AsnC family transcriptional regulator [Acidobacteriota bacterium]